MANFYVSSTAYALVTQWSLSTVTALGTIRRQLAAPTAGNERCFRCTTAGTTGAVEPTWVLTASATTADNTVTWTEVTGQETFQSAANWTAPAATLDLYVAQTGGRGATGDQIFIADTHTETWTTARDWGSHSVDVICVTVAGSTLPPGVASLSTGATIATTGTSNIPIGSINSVYGCNFSAGSAANLANIYFSRTGIVTTTVYRRCAFKLNNTNTASKINSGQSAASHAVLDACTVEFGNASQGIAVNVSGSSLTWRNQLSSPATLGTVPTALFQIPASLMPVVRLEGLDLSNITTTLLDQNIGANINYGVFTVIGCKLNAAVTVAPVFRMGDPASEITVEWSDSTSGASAVKMTRALVFGKLESDTTIARSGGADTGVEKFSYKMTPNASGVGAPTINFHPATSWLRVWNTLTASSKNITVHVLMNKTTLMDTSKVWLEVGYMAATDTPAFTYTNNGPTVIAAVSPAANTATTQDWTVGSVTARANLTVYAGGEIRKVASAPGKIWLCTVSGTSAASEAASFATANDGDTVTESTAVAWRALYRASMTIAVTPQKAGWIYARVHHIDSQVTATAIYVDPKILVT